MHVTVAVFLASVLTPIGLSLAAPPAVPAVPRAAAPHRAEPREPVLTAAAPAAAIRTASEGAAEHDDAAEPVAQRRPDRAAVSRSRPGDPGVQLPVPAAARAAAAAATPTPEPPEVAPAPTAMARAGEIALVVPSEPGVTAIVGFHQASGGAVAMQPLGRLLDSAFPGWEPEADGGAGHDHAVLASRGRGTDPTTAVDVALPPGSTVTAPTTGVVELVSDYALYGRHADITIRIVPEGVSDAVVQVFHVEDPVVAEGDRVEAGVTPLATVRQLPVKSQIDRITGDTRPHAHVEVRRT